MLFIFNKKYQKMNILNFRRFLESVDLSNTYLKKYEELKIKFEDLIKNEIFIVCKNNNINLPIEKFSKDFILIKNEILKFLNKGTNLVIDKYINEYGINKKYIEGLILKNCCDNYKELELVIKPKINIDKLEFKLVNNKDGMETYKVIFPKEIKDFILKNKDINYLDSIIYIICDTDRYNMIHFPGRAERINLYKNNKRRNRYLGKHGLNLYSELEGINKNIRGYGIGYTIYKEFIKFKGFCSSTYSASDEAKNIWKKLFSDSELSGIIGNYEDKKGYAIVFDKKFKGDFKKVANNFVSDFMQNKIFFNRLEIKDVRIDDFLKSKMN